MIDVMYETYDMDETYRYSFEADKTSATEDLTTTFTVNLQDIAVLEEDFNSDNIVYETLD
jgi:hypothetical protein